MRGLAAGLALCVAAAAAAQAAVPRVEELRGLSLQELANIDVTGVFKRPEPLSKTPASVYVITREDIRRSGARTLVEALRLAPNLEVARRNANDYAVTARGFDFYQASNKMLVEIDGRSIYTPLHAGVLWDEQQVPIEDIDRIEVISGPAGTIWGANAVNGVINVITRDAHDTQGGYGRLDVGSQDSGGTAQYGGRFGSNGAFRVYGQGSNFGETRNANGTGRNDDWRARQGGFRADWSHGADAFNLEGDAYRNTVSEGMPAKFNTGGNITGHWTRQLDNDSSVALQAYYLRADREPLDTTDDLDTFDIEGRHNFRLGQSNEVVWGAGYRLNRTTFRPNMSAPFFITDPPSEHIHIANLFAEDTVALRPDLKFTFGSKFEYSSLSGMEVMPSVRAGWQFAQDHFLWAAVSRAVRTPSVIDRDFRTIPAITLFRKAGDSFDSEKLIAYELGYRGRPDDRSTLSVTAYYHDYDDLRIIETVPGTTQITFGNGLSGFTAGVEVWGDYRVTSRWRLMAGANLLRKRLTLGPNAITTALEQHEGDDPAYQLFLRSYFNITDDIEFDVNVRKVGPLPFPQIPGYVGLDLHLGWHVTDRVELALVGQNLAAPNHIETGTAAATDYRGEIPRAVYGSITVKF